MADIPALDALGRRIAIFGPSNSGKSTRAEPLPVVHKILVFERDLLRAPKG